MREFCCSICVFTWSKSPRSKRPSYYYCCCWCSSYYSILLSSSSFWGIFLAIGKNVCKTTWSLVSLQVLQRLFVCSCFFSFLSASIFGSSLTRRTNAMKNILWGLLCHDNKVELSIWAKNTQKGSLYFFLHQKYIQLIFGHWRCESS